MASWDRQLKDPQAVLDYQRDWSDWLVSDDRITASSWVLDDGVTLDSHEFTDTIATAWISGGTVGQKYKCVNQITTAAGRTDERTLLLTICQK